MTSDDERFGKAGIGGEEKDLKENQPHSLQARRRER